MNATDEMIHGDSPLAGKVAIVTGASKGIGRAIASAYADAGARVGFVGRDEAALDDAVRQAGSERALPIIADVTDPTSADHVLAAVMEAYGRVDVLVNNAGIHYATPFESTSAEDWRRIIDVNLLSAVDMTRVVGQALIAQGSGHVINVASAWATKTVPKNTAYVTSKAALVQFTRTLAREWAHHGIRVNALAPGYFDTGITEQGMGNPQMYDKMVSTIPQRRIAEPHEIGPLAVFLASSGASYMTGATVAIDGGMQLT